jgi:putative endonuclease
LAAGKSKLVAHPDEINAPPRLPAPARPWRGGTGGRADATAADFQRGASTMWEWLLSLLRWGPRPGSGGEGERRAAEWLQRERRFEVVTRNWRNPHDRREELDLVCRDGDVLVFVEVKARAAGALVPGYFAVNQRKKRILRRAAATYLRGLTEKPRTFRFDIVEVTLAVGGGRGAQPPEIRHFQNVPLFSKHFRP